MSKLIAKCLLLPAIYGSLLNISNEGSASNEVFSTPHQSSLNSIRKIFLGRCADKLFSIELRQLNSRSGLELTRIQAGTRSSPVAELDKVWAILSPEQHMIEGVLDECEIGVHGPRVRARLTVSPRPQSNTSFEFVEFWISSEAEIIDTRFN